MPALSRLVLRSIPTACVEVAISVALWCFCLPLAATLRLPVTVIGSQIQPSSPAGVPFAQPSCPAIPSTRNFPNRAIEPLVRGFPTAPGISKRRCLLHSSTLPGDPEIFKWARERGAWISEKLELCTVQTIVGVENGALRGLRAKAYIQAGEQVMTFPAEGFLLSASAIRKEGKLGVGDRIRQWESEQHMLSDEEVLALFLAVARTHEADHEFDVYVSDLPETIADLPIFWSAEEVESLLGSPIVDRVQRMKATFESALQTCSQILGPGEAAEELEWAWSQVQTRALRERVGSGEATAVESVFFPVADLINHGPASLPERLMTTINQGSGARFANHKGPAIKSGPAEEGQIVFTAERNIESGEEVSWSYGRLSNEDLLLKYGFVPQPYLHADNRYCFALPGTLFRRSMEALDKEAKTDEVLIRRKVELLEQLGAVRTENEDLPFEVLLGGEPLLLRDDGRPVPLLLLAKIMSITQQDELATVSLMSPGETSGSISTQNEARALKWTTWLTAQVDEQLGPAGNIKVEADGSNVRKGWGQQIAVSERLCMSFAVEEVKKQAEKHIRASAPGSRSGKPKRTSSRSKKSSKPPGKGFGR